MSLTKGGNPAEFDILDLASTVDEGVGVDAAAVHVTVVGRNARIVQQISHLCIQQATASKDCMRRRLPVGKVPKPKKRK